MKHIIEQITDTGASPWINAFSLKKKNLNLNKEEFRDSLRVRYDMPLENIPLAKYACGEQFNINHALSCKKDGFVTHRHNNIQDFFSALLDKVCINVEN